MREIKVRLATSRLVTIPVVVFAVSLLLAGLITGCGSTADSLGSEKPVLATAAPATTAPPVTSITLSGDAGASTRTATVAGLTLDYPAGWVAQVTGDSALTVAQRQDDLGAPRPAGARVMVELSSAETSDATALVQLVVGGGETAVSELFDGYQVAADPQQLDVGGRQGVLVGIADTRGGISTCAYHIVVSLEDGRIATLTLEATAEAWTAARDTMNTILSSVRFQ